jgi:hypothetical protein
VTVPEEVDAAVLIQDATRRSELRDAIAWLAEEHPMSPNTNWTQLLRALVAAIDDKNDVHLRALRRVTREAARSDVDTARVIFDPENWPKAEQFAGALAELTSRSRDGTLAGLEPGAVLRAHYANPLSLEALCLAVGVPFSDAKEWFGPTRGPWTIDHVTKLLAHLDDLVEGRVEALIPGSEPVRAVELIDNPGAGWARLDELRTGGVPYELLLEQRYVGGVWLLHKNKTSSFANVAAATLLCTLLTERSVDFRRASSVGGEARQRDLQELSGIPDKRVGVVAVGGDGVATFAVTFSAARDGGTARANGDGLLQIPQTPLPLGIVLTGLGWAQRPETERLALRYGGRLFTERSVEDLVDCIERASA